MQKELEDLNLILALGEGQAIEFKESPSKLDREIVAFANSVGGTIYCGISDSGSIVGTSVNNKILSQIQDIARNCDPAIQIALRVIDKKVIVITVPDGQEKPYQSSGGFYLRMGANSQKLKASEIRNLLAQQQVFFDSKLNLSANLTTNLSTTRLEHYCQQAHIAPLSEAQYLLESLHAAGKGDHKQYFFTNAGLLLFAESPKKFLPESYLTLVRYQGTDRFSILDRQELAGNLIEQIEGALNFVKRHISLSYEMTGDARRVERYEYPLVAVREALINALIHRDYSFQNSCVYLNIYSDRLEIENPGGIHSGISVSEIEGRSIRRNPTLADLLYRAGYGEKLGSGLIRIKQALAENNNPPYQIAATNFFSLRFLPRVATFAGHDLNDRQLEILNLLKTSRRDLSAAQLAEQLKVSPTTISREILGLREKQLVQRIGVGKLVRYRG